MATIYKLKNVSGSDGNWAGQEIIADESYVVSSDELEIFRHSTDLFAAVANGDILVESDVATFNDPIAGWNYFEGDTLPKSTLDGKKLAVHTSYKPDLEGVNTYAIWSGCGDDPLVPGTSNGDILTFTNLPNTASVTKLMRFSPENGRVWVHEGYLKFNNGGNGDYIEASVVAEGVPLQTSVSLDLIMDGNTIKYSPSGPGTGTHGFADPTKITLIPRTFSKDGDWNFVDGVMTPNLAGTGLYNMSDIDTIVHRYFNKISCYGSCASYFSMSSDETSELLANYHMKITTHNISNTTWSASVLVELYREKTT